ncbi:hypothetical protein LTR56_022991 [Elasticomyces elasticus]|nr:hypothetical protein LTR22_027919 [Elasticomyces elasticus]KAK3621127.1 hypothetical protein LTR56_022991 [Elasticomyces elasticus]KAK4907389.1 hypothetical protein LTR49_023572 [Elasticomyces elasticus]
MTAAWNKIEKYYKLCDTAPVYYAAVVLNPTLKMQCFKDQWSEGTDTQQTWIPWVEGLVKQLWGAGASRYGDAEDTPFSRLANAKRLKQNTAASKAAASAIDQLEVYLQLPPLDHDEQTLGKLNII